MTTSMPLLEIRNLKTHFFTDDGVVRAVDGVSLSVASRETLGVVGESGCGKSIMAFSVMGLVRKPGRIVEGEILFHRNGDPEPRDLARMAPEGREIRAIRGNEIGMVFQEPMTSLSPVHTVGHQIAEAVRLHQDVGWKEAHRRAVEALGRVRLPRPDRQAFAYPHELSGGMRQRAMIAMALSCGPHLLMADEPTTALDVTVQSQILSLMKGLQSERDMAIVLITHDLGVIAGMADRVAVMYLGKVVESADTRTLFRDPRHPYTQGLLRSIPKIGRGGRLVPIEGAVPSPLEVTRGCAFAPRCPKAMPVCAEIPPTLEVAPGHRVSCWLEGEGPRSQVLGAEC